MSVGLISCPSIIETNLRMTELFHIMAPMTRTIVYLLTIIVRNCLIDVFETIRFRRLNAHYTWYLHCNFSLNLIPIFVISVTLALMGNLQIQKKEVLARLVLISLIFR